MQLKIKNVLGIWKRPINYHSNQTDEQIKSWGLVKCKSWQMAGCWCHERVVEGSHRAGHWNWPCRLHIIFRGLHFVGNGGNCRGCCGRDLLHIFPISGLDALLLQGNGTIFLKKRKVTISVWVFLNWCHNAYREREAQHFEGWLLLSVRKSPNNAHNPANEAGEISLAKFTMLKGITLILSVWLIKPFFSTKFPFVDSGVHE